MRKIVFKCTLSPAPRCIFKTFNSLCDRLSQFPKLKCPTLLVGMRLDSLSAIRSEINRLNLQHWNWSLIESWGCTSQLHLRKECCLFFNAWPILMWKAFQTRWIHFLFYLPEQQHQDPVEKDFLTEFWK